MLLADFEVQSNGLEAAVRSFALTWLDLFDRTTADLPEDAHERARGMALRALLRSVVTDPNYRAGAIDAVGAGIGEKVIITSDGRAAREILGAEATPVRWSVIGICDE